MKTAVKERMIHFNGEMVRAILAGRKTQTRRLVKPQPMYEGELGIFNRIMTDPDGEGYPGPDEFGFFNEDQCIKSPFGKVGDRLWVRETWRPQELKNGLDGILFRADDGFVTIENTAEAADLWVGVNQRNKNWRPSIHMPRWASRIDRSVIGIRVQRVQDISNADALEEGVVATWGEWESVPAIYENDEPHEYDNRQSRDNFAILWDSIYGEGEFSWNANPFVWAVEFERMKENRT